MKTSVTKCAGKCRARRQAFTLVELLAVLTIAGILMTAVIGAYTQARRHAKIARAQTELRELLKAWSLYYQTYGAWPAGYDTTTKDMSYAALQPLFASGNDKGIPFLSIATNSASGNYVDPWGKPYQVTFKIQSGVKNETALRISVSFPNSERNRP
jgi:prepilin-type N-terminal cleavage/methylation domain-containing protein